MDGMKKFFNTNWIKRLLIDLFHSDSKNECIFKFDNYQFLFRTHTLETTKSFNTLVSHRTNNDKLDINSRW